MPVNPCKAASPGLLPTAIISPMSEAPTADFSASAHVLLVDDDIELVELLRAYLVSDGFRVSVAHDGESGVRSALVELPDIAVIDVMMPGYSGIEVLRRIRARSSSTSSTSSSTRRTCALLGASVGAASFMGVMITAGPNRGDAALHGFTAAGCFCRKSGKGAVSR